MNKFNSSNLTFARKRRGLTKIKLAEMCGLSSQSISNFESTKRKEEPSEETLLILAKALNFPETFFYRESLKELSEDTASFRALSKMTALQKNSVYTSAELAFHVNNWLEDKFTLPKHNLPDFREDDPKQAAQSLRHEWKLSEKTIKNMVHLLESKGIRVFFLAENSKNVDAFSCWDNGIPYVFLNTTKSAERSRFDAAHELGHLILHSHGIPRSQDAEKEANMFASAFLMPEATVRANCPYMPSIPNLIKLKHKWIVSLAALIYRLRDLDLLTEWHYRTLNIEMNKKGYKTKEPEEAKRETSLIFEKIIQSLKEDGITKTELAKELGFNKYDLEELFGLPIKLLPGGNTGESQKSKANLFLVKE